MLKSFISIALFWLFTGVVSCTTPPPPQPELEFLYSLNCSLAPIFTYGVGPFGEVRAIGITGGTFEGPKIKGGSPLRISSRTLNVSHADSESVAL